MIEFFVHQTAHRQRELLLFFRLSTTNRYSEYYHCKLSGLPKVEATTMNTREGVGCTISRYEILEPGLQGKMYLLAEMRR